MIELLAKLNWFESIGALLRIGIPSHRFVVDRNAGCSGQQIENMLRNYGIKIWGRSFTSNTLRFRVKRVQAAWAEYLLFRYGVPVLSPLVYPRNATYRQPAARGKNRKPGRGVLAELFS